MDSVTKLCMLRSNGVTKRTRVKKYRLDTLGLAHKKDQTANMIIIKSDKLGHSVFQGSRLSSFDYKAA